MHDDDFQSTTAKRSQSRRSKVAERHHGHRELMTLYYDYAQGCGNGKIPEGRTISSFTLEPAWNTRPMPPRDKWGIPATDTDLGLAR